MSEQPYLHFSLQSSRILRCLTILMLITGMQHGLKEKQSAPLIISLTYLIRVCLYNILCKETHYEAAVT